jgi:hypothetical protein
MNWTKSEIGSEQGKEESSFSEEKEAKRLLFLAQLHVSRPMI